MRVLLSTYGSRGDVEPMVALAVQLRALGAEVRVCAPPDVEFADLLAGVGMPVVPFGRAWRSWERPTTPEKRTRRVAEFIEAQYDTLVTEATGCDLLVATGMSHFVAQSVAETVGIPLRYAIFAPNVPDDPDARHWKALFGPAIDSHRASIGLPAVGDVRRFMFTEHPLLAADPTLGPWEGSAGLGVVQTGAWILPDVRPLPAGLVSFLDAGPPPVYVGFGSMRSLPEGIATVTIEAIRAQGCRVVVGHGWADLGPVDDPADCFVVGEVNQQALFGRVAAVVHHGGAGTTTTAARAGVPQVVVPQAGGDQPYWAGRVSELGIGAAHDGPAPTAESLTAALTAVLTPDSRAQAAAVARWVVADGATVAAQLLLDRSR